MRKPVVVTQVIPKLQKFTIESLTKYLTTKQRNLVEQLFLYPNFGQGFKVFMRMRPFDYYIVDNVTVKNHRHGKIFGIFYENSIIENKIAKIRRTLQDGRWDYEYPEGKCYSDNGVEYDIKRIAQLREEKVAMMEKRNKIIGFVPQIILDKEQKRKAKLEALSKKKK